jgi:hypothetical protein
MRALLLGFVLYEQFNRVEFPPEGNEDIESEVEALAGGCC